MLGPTGLTLRNLVGNPFEQGVLTNFTLSSAWKIDQMGPALDLNGSTHFINFDNPAIHMRPDVALTFAIWVNMAAGSPGNEFLVHNHVSPQGYNIFINTSGQPRWVIEPVGAGASSATASTDIRGANHFLVGTYNSANGSNDFYVDAVPEATIVGLSGLIDYHQSLYIGRQVDSDQRHFTGTVYEIRVYNRVLSPREIRIIYEMPYADLLPKPQTVGKAIAAAPGAGIRNPMAGPMALRTPLGVG